MSHPKLRMRSAARAGVTAALVGLGACSNGSGGGLAPATGGTAPPFTAVTQVRVSQPVSLPPNCDAAATEGTLYPGTVVEASVAVSPANSSNLIATWQQNRWSSGGSQAIGIAASFDGGNSWTASSAAFSRCSGGSSANAGDYARTSNAWISIAPNGVAWALALSFTGQFLASGSTSGMLVANSVDGGSTWSLPIALIQDGSGFFNDKGAITADPNDSNFVYAVWDRLAGQTTGPSYFSSTTNAGSTWNAARNIYDPGPNNQTIGNLILVLPDGKLVNLFNEIDSVGGGATTATLKAITSTDQGNTWSATAVTVSQITAVGTVDPSDNTPVRDSSLLFTAAVGASGIIYVAWQDARFSQGDHDGIAFTQSADEGVTWATPVQVNAEPTVQAFTPTLDVRADGTIAVTYFDLRNDTPDVSALGLYADCWLVESTDAGQSFTESHLSGSFDLRLAPKTTSGYFLGDYQGLAHQATAFLPLYAQPDVAGTIATDVFISFPPATAAATARVRQRFAARAAPAAVFTAAARQRISERIRFMRTQRLKGGP